MPKTGVEPKQVFEFTITMRDEDKVITSRTTARVVVKSFLDVELVHVIDGLRSRIEYRESVNVLKIDYRSSNYTLAGVVSVDREFVLRNRGAQIEEYLLDLQSVDELSLNVLIYKEKAGKVEEKIIVEIV